MSLLHLLLLEVLFVCLHYIEALHDSAMIDIQNYQSPDYAINSFKWHKYAAWYNILMVFIASFAIQNFWMMIPLGLIRVIFFPVMLNLVRTEKKTMFYLSDVGYDAQLKAIFGENAGVYQFALGLIALVVANIFIL